MVDSNQRVVSRKRGQYGAGLVVLSLQKKWWLLPGSNQRPVDYDSVVHCLKNTEKRRFSVIFP